MANSGPVSSSALHTSECISRRFRLIRAQDHRTSSSSYTRECNATAVRAGSPPAGLPVSQQPSILASMKATFDIDSELYRAVKVEAARADRSVRDVIEEALEAWLARAEEMEDRESAEAALEEYR